MRPEEGYDGRRRSGLPLQVVLLVMFLAALIGGIWIYEGETTGPAPAPSPASAIAPQPAT